MPRSKRDKEVSLTKVKKKTREVKEALVKEIRASVDKYKHLFVFNIEDMRSTHFIQVRQKFKANSRFFFGKNNVMAIALGKDTNSEYAPDLHKVSQRLGGQCGLMFTLLSKAKVMSTLKELSMSDYARAGHIARETITIPEGPLPQFAFSMEPQLRKLGLPTKLDKGAIVMYQDYEICKEGEPITAEQAKILKLFDYKLAEFKLHIVSQWDKEDGYRNIESKEKS
ncbi:unnamed protein product [Nippostrongylus brasiliensis]|uniref:Ribosome assembly factor mrt4 n=1 Tax=Nippostrongylus brasiliensis TaxID=27835 RepID=A0A0N4XZB3_NIPBR|nr:hypothetical protein Q1695_013996 [Nippostrongylus brasiliensis]VDL72092.1 unnamed protein product [Nippostrongylus brasiliensis]